MRAAALEAVQILGGLSATARAMGVTPTAVRKWTLYRVPAERVLDLEAATEYRVTRYRLRPDIYPEAAR